MPESTEMDPIKETVQQGAEVENGATREVLEKPTVEDVTAPKYKLSKFKLTRILQNNTLRKTIALLGTFPDISETDAAIILLEKQAFKESDVQTTHTLIKDEAPRIFSESLQVHTEFINNIYGSFQCIPSTEFNGIKTTVVYPATEKHVEKYSVTPKYLVKETYDLYKQLTLPFITKSQFSLDWVYNILEHRQETDRIVYEDSDPDTGFVLLPDLKWDGKTLETLYLLAIVHKHDIKSLRDLNDTHLPLLRNLRDGIAEAIEKHYGLCGSKLRMYFHYQPSFYHLHVHINPVRGDAPGIWCEKSHMLDTVISNIELIPDYYQRVTLPFALFEGSKLLDEYENQKAVRKQIKTVLEMDHINPNMQNEKCETQETSGSKSVTKKMRSEENEVDEPPAKKLKDTTAAEQGSSLIESATQ